ncbi:hypothetical protein KY284_028299 [Solanum tuberosum]|nr:hypothetical protein KY284_028299 [Solanum tuberosum]
MKNVMKVVFVLSIIVCVLVTPTIARVSGSTRTSTTRLTPVVRAGARADAPSTNNSSSSTPSIAMALFAYLSFVYF